MQFRIRRRLQRPPDVLWQGDDQEAYLILAKNALMYNEGVFPLCIVMHAFVTSGVGFSLYDKETVIPMVSNNLRCLDESI